MVDKCEITCLRECVWNVSDRYTHVSVYSMTEFDEHTIIMNTCLKNNLIVFF